MSKTALLTTVGARSGRQRTVPVAFFADGDDAWLVVGSMGGAPRHPSWYINLAKKPDQVWIEIGPRRIHVRPELLRGEARAERWRRIVATSKGFAKYEESTDREIPVVRLTPVS